jgi:FtsZ-interacting cell division protein ZipA
MDQRTMVVVVVAIVVIAAIAVVAWLYSRRQRSTRLRQRFGPEYDRVVRQEGDQRKAEGLLEFRAKRREGLPIRPLERAQRDAFADRWIAVQSRFVDHPKGAVTDADLLISEVMAARGYPMSDFDQRAADISVDHPQVVENYRVAHSIALRHGRGEASTEDLRKAMVHYRSLFEQLLGETTTNRKERLA